jgi:hypothetical protein
MRTYRIAPLLFLLLAIPQAGRADVPVTARQLVQTVDAALAGTAQAAQKLDSRNPRYAPFLSALQAMRTRVSRIASARGNELFLLVDQGSSDLGELRVAWARTGAKNEQIAGQLRIASTAYRSLRSQFGREGVRLQQGGALSEAEKQQLARLQASERRFAERARRLRAEAQRRRDAATAAEMERFRAEAEQIAQASADLASYLNALIAASEMRGEWQANVPYVRKIAPPAELAAAEETVQDLYVDADIGHVFVADLGKTPEAPSEASADEGAAPAKVEVFQPGEEVREPVAVVEPIPAPDDEDEEAAEPAESAAAQPAEEGATVSGQPVPEAGEEAAAPAPEEPVKEEKPAAAKGNAHPEAAVAPAAPIPPPIG